MGGHNSPDNIPSGREIIDPLPCKVALLIFWKVALRDAVAAAAAASASVPNENERTICGW